MNRDSKDQSQHYKQMIEPSNGDSNEQKTKHPSDNQQINNSLQQKYQLKNQNLNYIKKKTESPWVLVIYAFTLALLLILEQFFRGPLYQLTLDIVPGIQAKLTAPAIWYFKFMTLFGYGHAAIIFFALFYAFSTREKAFYLLLVHTVAGIMNQELKMIYHNPRPYISSPDIQALACSKSFGNPSGHSSLSSCFYTSLFLVVMYDCEWSNVSVRGRQIIKREGRLSYWLSLVLLIFLVINVGLSRVALGVHSLNQILYGWSYGLWIALFMFKYVRPGVYKHIRNLEEKPNGQINTLQDSLLQRDDNLNRMSMYAQQHDYFGLGMRAIIIYFLIIIFSVVNYHIVRTYFQYPQEWLDVIIQKCGHGKTTLDEKTIFTDSAFIKTGLVSAIFGAYFGILYDSHYMGGTPSTINNTTMAKGFMRIVIGGIIIIPFVMPYFLINTQFSVGVLYLVKCQLPFFILMFMVFSWLKSVFLTFNLVDQN
eukprot:403355575